MMPEINIHMKYGTPCMAVYMELMYVKALLGCGLNTHSRIQRESLVVFDGMSIWVYSTH